VYCASGEALFSFLCSNRYITRSDGIDDAVCTDLESPNLGGMWGLVPLESHAGCKLHPARKVSVDAIFENKGTFCSNLELRHALPWVSCCGSYDQGVCMTVVRYCM